jgi:phosphoesterase RecJ-like protein
VALICLNIIVDTSADSLFENLAKSGQKPWIAAKPCIIIDHHKSEADITFATVILNEPVVATGQIIYDLAQEFSWKLNEVARDMLTVSILSDSLGLTSEGTTARSIHIIGELVEKGVSISKLESLRRETMRKSPDIIKYKGQLLQRIEYFADNRIALITIPWEEIERYSYAYNPSMLVIDDMRLSEGTDIAIAFKVYKDGRITAKIRCNYGVGIGAKLAEHFGGGGHTYASGFKIQGKPFDDVKQQTIDVATKLLDELKEAGS